MMRPAHYYNEHDPFAAEWLRRLMRAGLIPEGEVDERDIRQVEAVDLRGFVQCHFFAGIAGWSEALRISGWGSDRPCWTGSCPCQPFSSAGKRKAEEDDRHLWPAFFRLIRECRPDTVFGEQVEGAIRLGWLDGVQRDLEGEGYAVGHCVLGAHGVGSPHIRQRLYWVAHRSGVGHGADAGHRIGGRTGECEPRPIGEAERHEVSVDAERRGGVGGSGVGHGADAGRLGVRAVGRELGGAAGGVGGEVREQRVRADAGDGGHARGVEHPASDGRGEGRTEPDGRFAAGGCSGVGVADAARLGHRAGEERGSDRQGEGERRVVVVGRHGSDGGVADAESNGPHIECGTGGGKDRTRRAENALQSAVGSRTDGLEHTDDRGCDQGRKCGDLDEVSGRTAVERVPITERSPHDRAAGVAHGAAVGDPGSTGLEVPAAEKFRGPGRRGEGREPGQPGGHFWDASDLVHCRDGKWRRIPAGSAEPLLLGVADGLPRVVGGGGVAGGGHGQGSFPLAFEKVEGRAAALKGLGNAVVPQLAAEFVRAVMDTLGLSGGQMPTPADAEHSGGTPG